MKTFGQLASSFENPSPAASLKIVFPKPDEPTMRQTSLKHQFRSSFSSKVLRLEELENRSLLSALSLFPCAAEAVSTVSESPESTESSVFFTVSAAEYSSVSMVSGKTDGGETADVELTDSSVLSGLESTSSFFPSIPDSSPEITTALSKPARLQTETLEESIKVSWDFVWGANAYVLEYRSASENQWTLLQTSQTSISFEREAGVSYEIRVKAIRTDGSLWDSEYACTSVSPVDFQVAVSGTLVEYLTEWDSWSLEIRTQSSETIQFEIAYNSRIFAFESFNFVQSGTKLTCEEIPSEEEGIGFLRVSVQKSEEFSSEESLTAALNFKPASKSGITVEEEADWAFTLKTNENQSKSCNAYAVPYDLDEDGAIASEDLSIFSYRFNEKTSSSEDFLSEDFDQNGYVDVLDLILFAQNFGFSCERERELIFSSSWCESGNLIAESKSLDWDFISSSLQMPASGTPILSGTASESQTEQGGNSSENVQLGENSKTEEGILAGTGTFPGMNLFPVQPGTQTVSFSPVKQSAIRN